MNRLVVQKQFGENAQRYVTSRVHALGASLAEMVRLAQPQPHWLALDVAPGGGHSALAIAPYVRMVVALDVTLPMLQAARTFAQTQDQMNILWAQGDGGRLPFAGRQFDLVTCRVALHHFPHQAAAIADWARVLKPGGRLVLVDNIGPEDEQANRYVNAFEKLRDNSHGKLYPPAVLIAFIEAAGLRLLESLTIQKPMAFHAWMERMQVPDKDRERLTQMLWESGGSARTFLDPQGKGKATTFSLREGIFLAQKPL
jgi:SAM-dependent methyltransferase